MLSFPKKFSIAHLLILPLIALVITVIVDLFRISSYEVYPRRPSKSISTEQNNVYYDLVNGVGSIDWDQLAGTLEYINDQYDCSDFRLVNLIRIIYEFEANVPPGTMDSIENTLLDFRYWWDEAGENSMCYWSENHQILFASAEYLTGQKYPDAVFSRSGLTGKEHMARAKKRALDWLEMRWNYGFTEFFSGVYYQEDIGAMINIIDFANDEELVQKTKIIMDLLFFDVATQNIHTMFVSASGRAYKGNRTGGPEATLSGLTDYYWGSGKKIGPGITYGMMTTDNYILPPVLIDIAKDTNNVVIRQNNGLDIIELDVEGYFGTDDRSMMMQLGMEAFTNPEIIRNSLSLIRKNKMFSNEFIKDFRMLDFAFLRFLHLEPLLVRMIDPQSNGVAIQKGNTYTYKTADYSLYSAQDYHPGTYGDQHHVAGMNIGNSFSIFHTHPAIEEGVPRQSPNYWVGYGHLPHVCQDSNVSLAIYRIPEKKGLMEADLLGYTHAYFPTEQFDSVYIHDNYAMAKKGNTYCAFITRNPLELKDKSTDNLIQNGKKVFWIIEAGSQRDDRSFGAFCKRILDNQLTFDEESLALSYQSGGKTYKLKFRGDFYLNDQLVNIKYDRYDSPYCKAVKKAENIVIQFDGKSLYLDFHNQKRDF